MSLLMGLVPSSRRRRHHGLVRTTAPAHPPDRYIRLKPTAVNTVHVVQATVHIAGAYARYYVTVSYFIRHDILPYSRDDPATSRRPSQQISGSKSMFTRQTRASIDTYASNLLRFVTFCTVKMSRCIEQIMQG